MPIHKIAFIEGMAEGLKQNFIYICQTYIKIRVYPNKNAFIDGETDGCIGAVVKYRTKETPVAQRRQLLLL